MHWTTPKSCVLVPFVISHPSIEALEVAIDLVGGKQNLTNVHVVHVITQVAPMTPGLVFEAYTPRDLEQTARAAIQKELAENGYDGVQVHVEVGEPANAIRETAQACHAQVIVIPSHGRSGLERWLVGSVAEQVLRHAPCPVLVLPIAELAAQAQTVTADPVNAPA